MEEESDLALVFNKEINTFYDFLEMIKELKGRFCFDTDDILRDYNSYCINKLFINSSGGLIEICLKIERYILNLVEEDKKFTYEKVIKCLRTFVEDVIMKLLWIAEVYHNELDENSKLDSSEEKPYNVQAAVDFCIDYIELNEMFCDVFFTKHLIIDSVDFESFERRVMKENTDLPEYFSNDEIYTGEWISKSWFVIGVLFAKGDIKKVYEETKTFRKTAEKLYKESAHPYIAGSWNNTKQDDKNIFSEKGKIEILIKYCKKNNIVLCDSFKDRAKL